VMARAGPQGREVGAILAALCGLGMVLTSWYLAYEMLKAKYLMKK
jgi:hypothetical protein